MSFALDINKFAQKCGKNADLLTRDVIMKVTKSIDEMSPVGNPLIWKNPENKPDGYVG
jgi:hypothetical protein